MFEDTEGIVAWMDGNRCFSDLFSFDQVVYISLNGEGVYVAASADGELQISDRVFFRDILNSIAKVKGVGCAVLEVFFEGDDDGVLFGLYFKVFPHGGRNDELLLGIVGRYHFCELKLNASAFEVDGFVWRDCIDEPGWYGVFWAAGG